MTKRTIYWKTRDRDMIRSIRRFFGWPVYSSINGLQTVSIRDEHMEVFRKTEERGHFESLYMGNRVDVLRMILEYRGDRTDRITLITSNLPINHQKLIDRYGDRVASRLTEMCNYFEIKGADRRKVRNLAPNATKSDGATNAPSN